jgi:hypothetical protein
VVKSSLSKRPTRLHCATFEALYSHLRTKSRVKVVHELVDPLDYSCSNEGHTEVAPKSGLIIRHYMTTPSLGVELIELVLNEFL